MQPCEFCEGINGMWEHFKYWLSRPYHEDMTAWDWFLLIGLFLVLLWCWGIILAHLRSATE